MTPYFYGMFIELNAQQLGKSMFDYLHHIKSYRQKNEIFENKNFSIFDYSRNIFSYI